MSTLKDRFAAIAPKFNLLHRYAASPTALFFVRRPLKPSTPRPAMKRDSAPESIVVATGHHEAGMATTSFAVQKLIADIRFPVRRRLLNLRQTYGRFLVVALCLRIVL